MPRIHFLKDHDHTPEKRPRTTVAYLAGQVLPVPKALADQLVEAGVAEPVADDQANPVRRDVEGEGNA